MTQAQRQQSRRLVLLAILVVSLLLTIALTAVGPRLLGQASVGYGAPNYAPEQATYCPGEVLRAKYSIERRQPGPVEVVGSWCTPENVCLLSLSTIQYGHVFKTIDPITATLQVTIPVHPRLTAGSEWVYVRSVRQTGQDRFSMFTVPFQIAATCN